MSQKETVLNFLSTLENNAFTKKEVISMFYQNENTSVKESNFKFYLNEAISKNIFSPKEDSINVLGVPFSAKPENNMELEIVTVDATELDPNKFKAWATGTAFDKIASKRMGVMPGTTYMVTGESGAGKSTICTNIAQYLEEANPDLTAGFVSCEMDQDDWSEEVLDNPLLGSLESVFMLKYLEASNYYELLEQALCRWNFVILDSFEVVIDQLREVLGLTPKKAESKLINLLRKVASEKGSTIFVIQQYTKGGTFVGSNKIKHMLTGLIYVKFDNDGDRYIYFDKNRRGGHMIGKRLYFTKNKQTGRLEFDANKFDNSQRIAEFAEENKENIVKENEFFNDEFLDQVRMDAERKRQLIDGPEIN